jgi:hypothetical protein
VFPGDIVCFGNICINTLHKGDDDDDDDDDVNNNNNNNNNFALVGRKEELVCFADRNVEIERNSKGTG